MDSPVITWRTPEYRYKNKNADWFWAIWIIAISLSVVSVIIGNILLGALVLISAFALTVNAIRKPRIIDVEINENGIRIGKVLYPHTTLSSFGIDDSGEIPRLVLKSSRPFIPYLTIPIENLDAESVREVAGEYLPEEELSEPISVKIMERLGF